MARQYRTVTAYVEVSLDEFQDDQILEEVRNRDLVVGGMEEAERVYDALKEGRIDDALLILERQPRPKWRDLQSCQDYFKTAGVTQ